MFHTLGHLKNDATRACTDREPAVRIDEEARIVGAVDRIVAATTVERAHLVQHYGADPSRIAVIPCGVDTNLFLPGDQAAARAALGLDDRPRLLYVGRLAPIKGLETLLDAMARLRAAGTQVHLSIVGGDADEPLNGHEGALRARLARLDLGGTVTFVGAQPQERLRAWYVAADATVLPSHYESFGMVALEAMACGIPVVASRVGGLQTTVRDGVTGPAGARIRSGRAGRRARSPAGRPRPSLPSRTRGRAVGGPASLALHRRSRLPRVRRARRARVVPTSTPAAASDLASGAVSVAPAAVARWRAGGRSRTPVLHSRAPWRPCWRFAIFRPIFRRARRGARGRRCVVGRGGGRDGRAGRRIGLRQVGLRAQHHAARRAARRADRRRADLFKGRDLLTLSEDEMRRIRGREIGMIFQEPMTSLNPVLTIGRQLTEGLEIHLGMIADAVAATRAIELLGMVGIPDPARRLSQYPHQFCGGMRQRDDDRDGAGLQSRPWSSPTSRPPRSTSRSRRRSWS